MGLKGSWSYLHLCLMGEIVGCAGLLVSYRTAAHSGSHCIDRPWPCRATRPQPSWGVHGLSTIQGTRLLPHPQKASRSLGPSIVAASLWLSFHLPHLCNPFTWLHPLPELSFFPPWFLHGQVFCLMKIRFGSLSGPGLFQSQSRWLILHIHRIRFQRETLVLMSRLPVWWDLVDPCSSRLGLWGGEDLTLWGITLHSSI